MYEDCILIKQILEEKTNIMKTWTINPITKGFTFTLIYAWE